MLGPDHMLGFASESNHPWHQIPGALGFFAFAIPAYVIAIPLIVVEELAGGSSAIRETGSSPSKYFVVGVGFVGGYVLATPFFVLGLPFEGLGRGPAPATNAPSTETR